MWSICRKVAEKRPVLIGFDELYCPIEPHIGTVAFEFFRLAVMEVCIVKVVVSPVILGVADTASLVDQHFVEATVAGPKRIVVTQMPFAEYSRFVAAG